MRVSVLRTLLVEDSQHDADFVTMMLNRSPDVEVHVDRVVSLAEAVAASQRCTYDIILLDLGLPDSSGTHSVSRLRACAPKTPIVVLSGDDRNVTAIEAINLGAQDFLPKQHLVGTLLSRMVQHSISRHQQLVQAQADALIDRLTGVANRRGFDIELERRLSDFRRYGHRMCVALFDIDHFKQVNDYWGHDAGDQVIRSVVQAISNRSRVSDKVARYGGEEIAVIMPMTQLPDAEFAARDCRQAISQLSFHNQQIHVTVSVGVAEITESDDGPSLVARADDALYGAKRAGRNRCMLHFNGAVTDGLLRIENVATTTGIA
jgi:two-component system, cell cycle response regulator